MGETNREWITPYILSTVVGVVVVILATSSAATYTFFAAYTFDKIGIVLCRVQVILFAGLEVGNFSSSFNFFKPAKFDIENSFTNSCANAEFLMFQVCVSRNNVRLCGVPWSSRRFKMSFEIGFYYLFCLKEKNMFN